MATVEHLQHPEGPRVKSRSVSASLGHSDRLQRLEDRQRLLYRLVWALICALLVGGCGFFRLFAYTLNSNQSTHDYIGPTPTQQTIQTSEEVSTEISTVTKKSDTPEKPVAHLNGRGSQNGSVVLWSGNAFLHEMDYKDGRLTVKQDGKYFLYSRIGFSDFHCVFVNHKMMKSWPRYGDSRPILFELMQSTRYECPRRAEPSDVRNSYLGGVFQLHANDSIYVEVVGKVKIRHQQTENFFGAFML